MLLPSNQCKQFQLIQFCYERTATNAIRSLCAHTHTDTHTRARTQFDRFPPFKNQLFFVLGNRSGSVRYVAIIIVFLCVGVRSHMTTGQTLHEHTLQCYCSVSSVLHFPFPHSHIYNSHTHICECIQVYDDIDGKAADAAFIVVSHVK